MVDRYEYLYVHTCTIERRAALGTQDAAGQPQFSAWAAAHSDVPCRLDDRSGTRRSGRTNAAIVHPVLIVEPGTDILPTDRITNVLRNGTLIAEGPFVIIDPDDPAFEGDHLEVALEKA